MTRTYIARLGLAALVAGLVAAYFVFDLGAWLNFHMLVEHRQALEAWVFAHPLLAGGIYMVAYTVMAGLSLPAATVFTLAGGFLFGRWLGTALVVLSAATGATLAFLAARFLVGGWVQQRFSGQPRFDAVNEGIRRNGFNYLLFLRLVPLFPFFLINLACGLTRMPTRTFFFGTLIGIVPGSFVYVNAGEELSRINEPGDVLSATMLLALALLGLFSLVPVLYKRWRARRGGPSPAEGA